MKDYYDDTLQPIKDVSFVRYVAYDKFIQLLCLYTELCKYSIHEDFVCHIVKLSVLTDESLIIFDRLKFLQTTYDRLYCAPHGPNYIEGLRLCRN